MPSFAIMCNVSFETEVYVDADNLPEAMEKLSRSEDWAYDDPIALEQKFTPLAFIKPQVWDAEVDDYVPCNVIMFPVKEDSGEDAAEFEEDY